MRYALHLSQFRPATLVGVAPMRDTRKTILFALVILAALLGQSRLAHAFDSAILANFSDQITKQVCSDNGEWLRCYKVSPSFCTKVTEGFVRPCVQRLLGPVEKQLSPEEGERVAHQLLGCFNKQFMEAYGAQKLSTPECAVPPKHLQ